MKPTGWDHYSHLLPEKLRPREAQGQPRPKGWRSGSWEETQAGHLPSSGGPFCTQVRIPTAVPEAGIWSPLQRSIRGLVWSLETGDCLTKAQGVAPAPGLPGAACPATACWVLAHRLGQFLSSVPLLLGGRCLGERLPLTSRPGASEWNCRLTLPPACGSFPRGLGLRESLHSQLGPSSQEEFTPRCAGAGVPNLHA